MSVNKVLWWGRSDVHYSRNRIIRQLFNELGWEIIDFFPVISRFADIEAHLKAIPTVDLVWVPCFRQRDIGAAARWSKYKSIPLVCDPLISAYDKQVWEKAKFREHSKKAQNLLQWEQKRLRSADVVVADTEQHANFYHETLGVDQACLVVLPVSAEESLFKPKQLEPNAPLNILFFGSYIGLQGPDVIANAISLYDGPDVTWTFIGDGPLRTQIEKKLESMSNVRFIDWVPYEQLPDYIAKADICLGIFGGTEKTRRVIPNKVYQALACARPVITCLSEAYPQTLRDNANNGLFFIPPANAEALANIVAELALQPELVFQARQQALMSYQNYFSNETLKQKLTLMLRKVL